MLLMQVGTYLVHILIIHVLSLSERKCFRIMTSWYFTHGLLNFDIHYRFPSDGRDFDKVWFMTSAPTMVMGGRTCAPSHFQKWLHKTMFLPMTQLLSAKKKSKQRFKATNI